MSLAPVCLALFVVAVLAAGSVAASGGGQQEIAGSSLPFRRGSLDLAVAHPTSLAFGPDGRLYIASLDGTPPQNPNEAPPMKISAVALDLATKEVLNVEVIATGLYGVLGLAFDPAAPPSPVVLYASNQNPALVDGFEGEVSTFTGPAWQREDVIKGLPTSAPFQNHWTNGLAFDGQGRLFIAQGSATDAGLSDPPAGTDYWPETPLSAAILVAEIHEPGFDGTITYSPPGPPTNDNVVQTGGDVSVFAAGLRNPYDLAVPSNGQVYATDNGPLGFSYSATCTTASSPSSTSDELNLIEQGSYYGAPNRNRGLGIPDERQCHYRRPADPAGDFTPPIAVLPNHCSCDGIAEYTADAFGGAMQGDLVYVGLNGRLYRAVLSPDGRAVDGVETLATDFSWSLDVVVAAEGTMYIAEHLGDRISFVAPDSDGDGCSDGRELGTDQLAGGGRGPDNPWDFYDTNGDLLVDLDDVMAVALAFGPSTGPQYDPALDRSPAPPGSEPWRMGAPNASINLFDDIFGVARQFGASCIEPDSAG